MNLFQVDSRQKVLRLVGLLALLWLAFGGGLDSLLSAQTSPPEGESIRGTLTRITKAKDRIPVENVRIIVSLNGQVIEEARSDAEGKWRIEVPGPNTYRVAIDTQSLPDGVNLTNPDREVLDQVTVGSNQQKAVVFPLGEQISSGISRLEQFSNLFLSGLRLGAILALAATGLSLIVSVTKLVNFAHGEIITMAALLAYLFNVSGIGIQWPLLIAIVPAILITIFYASATEIGIWAPLRKRGNSAITIMIISIGLSIAIRYLFLLIFGASTRSFADYGVQETIQFLSFTTTPKTLFIIGTSLLLLFGVGLMLVKTRHGTSIRALSSNPDLAKASGVDTNLAILITWLLGSFITAMSGIFLGIAQGVDWQMGWQILLLVFASSILGGLGTPFGAMAGGFFVGIFLEISTYWIDTEFKVAMALGIMCVTLLWRPQGILGYKVRIA